MKIASVTCVFQDEKFIRPHFRMLSKLDENIVLLGKVPFSNYNLSGGRDRSVDILREEFPKVHIIEHPFDKFCGSLLNLGLCKAKELDCGAIIKLDVDMLMTNENFDRLLSRVGWARDFYYLDYGICTKNCCDDTPPSGLEPIIVNTDSVFKQPKTNPEGHDKICCTGVGSVIDWPDLSIYHFTGWRKGGEWKRVPEEIMQMFT